MITAYKHVRILLSLLKQYGIAHVVVSPGSRNISVVKSIEDDPFFTCFSVVDERSAAYFAVGMSLELGSPVALTSTSGQATRNYLPGMTEAYYRKAPILVLTTDYDENFTGQGNMQSVCQMSIPSDCANISVDIPLIKDENDEQLATRRLNQALDALWRAGGGPVHVNLRINKHWLKGDDTLETARRIHRHLPIDKDWPVIGDRRTLVVIGQHHPFSPKENQAFAAFADTHDVAIYVNHISNYHGRKTVHGNLRLSAGRSDALRPELLLTIGGHLGDYPLDGFLKNAGIEHWRIGSDGKYSDTYNTLTRIFECTDLQFLERMTALGGNHGASYYDQWEREIRQTAIPGDFPLSHALVAKFLSTMLPEGANLHFGILSSLRFWEFFSLSPEIRSYSNVAGFGIDGGLSTFLGQSVVSDALSFLIIGDLSFFYDMNALGIRHLRNNVRIVLINNRGGGEFRLNTHVADQFGDDSNRYIAASGHFGESAEGWVRNNEFTYIGVREKQELIPALEQLVGDSERPMLIEVFTDMKTDANALQSIIEANDFTPSGAKLSRSIKGAIPADVKKGLKKMLGR